MSMKKAPTKPLSQHTTDAQKSTPSIADKKNVKGAIEELEKPLLALLSGSPEAHALFQDLPEQIADLVPKEKQQVFVVTELCKAVWFKQQGETFFQFLIHIKCM